jgi:hypothetical protein
MNVAETDKVTQIETAISQTVDCLTLRSLDLNRMKYENLNSV